MAPGNTAPELSYKSTGLGDVASARPVVTTHLLRGRMTMKRSYLHLVLGSVAVGLFLANCTVKEADDAVARPWRRGRPRSLVAAAPVQEPDEPLEDAAAAIALFGRLLP